MLWMGGGYRRLIELVGRGRKERSMIGPVLKGGEEKVCVGVVGEA